MLNKIGLLVAAGALIALLTPSQAAAYGAAHVGYTHVGPNGVYHAGATEVGGYGGDRGYSGANVYREGYGSAAAVRTGTAGYGGAAVGGAAYRYSPTYSGGAAVGGAVHYDYVR